MNYDKDPWKGPVGKDGKPIPRGTPSANAAGTNSESPYEALSSKSFNYHFGRWKKALKEQKGKCMICFDTALNEHTACDCPIMKNLGFKIKKWSPSDTPPEAASRVATETPSTPAPAPAPTPTPPPPKDSQPGSAIVPGAFSAVTEPTYYDSGDEFNYEGKSDGAMYAGNSKHTSFAYSSASCSHTSLDHAHTDLPGQPLGGLIQDKMGGPCISNNLSASCTARDPQGVNTVYLPKTVLSLLANPPTQSIAHTQRLSSMPMFLVVADTGATDHMLPEKSAFISYYPVTGQRVHMGNNSFAPIAGYGTAITSLNEKKILIRNCLHVPDLRNPLCSLRAPATERMWLHWHVWPWDACFLPNVHVGSGYRNGLSLALCTHRTGCAPPGLGLCPT
jgi:hypothetical protein